MAMNKMAVTLVTIFKCHRIFSPEFSPRLLVYPLCTLRLLQTLLISIIARVLYEVLHKGLIIKELLKSKRLALLN